MFAEPHRLTTILPLYNLPRLLHQPTRVDSISLKINPILLAIIHIINHTIRVNFPTSRVLNRLCLKPDPRHCLHRDRHNRHRHLRPHRRCQQHRRKIHPGLFRSINCLPCKVCSIGRRIFTFLPSVLTLNIIVRYKSFHILFVFLCFHIFSTPCHSH